VFYGKTGRGKTHLSIGLGMKAIDMGLGVRFHQTAELVPPAGQGQTRRHPRDDAWGHRPGRPDHTGRVRLRALRHRRGTPALTGSSRAATRDGASSPPRTSSPANGARSSRTTNSPPRPATASCTTGGSSSPRARAAAPARPSCSAGTPPDNQENKKNACNCLNPKNT
jgi:hypothetical protein